MSGEVIVYAILGVGLIAYALTGGADFGGGLWDLVATGPRKAEQRRAIEEAIAPIWEANHVWLIFLIVLMFSAFPRAFAALTIALHVPLVLALFGISLRGASFVFRSYGLPSREYKRRWGRVFGASSAVTPILLGMSLAAVASGEVRVSLARGFVEVTSPVTAGWLTPFAVLTGFFSLALFALLAAVYLTVRTSGEVQEDFRRRALVLEAVAFVLAMLTLWRALVDAPVLFFGALAPFGPAPLFAVQGVTAAAALLTTWLLYKRRFSIARVTVAVQVALVVVGFGLAMRGRLIVPDLAIELAGAQNTVLPWVLAAIALGALLLAPSLWYLLRVFRASPTPPPDEEERSFTPGRGAS